MASELARYDWIDGYVSEMRSMGFQTLMYANLFEFGWNISTDPGLPADCAATRPADPFLACHEDTRCHSNRLVRDKFADAVIRDWETDEMVQPKGCLGTPCAMMDPGTDSYVCHGTCVGPLLGKRERSRRWLLWTRSLAQRRP